MDRETRRLIERQFYNYKHNRDCGAERVLEIAEKGMTASYDRAKSETNKINRPTEDKALKIGGNLKSYFWAKVVENCIVSFEFEVQGEIIRDKFFERVRYYKLIEKHGDGNESVYRYRYDKIINLAYEWAIKYNLIT